MLNFHRVGLLLIVAGFSLIGASIFTWSGEARYGSEFVNAAEDGQFQKGQVETVDELLRRSWFRFRSLRSNYSEPSYSQLSRLNDPTATPTATRTVPTATPTRLPATAVVATSTKAPATATRGPSHTTNTLPTATSSPKSTPTPAPVNVATIHLAVGSGYEDSGDLTLSNGEAIDVFCDNGTTLLLAKESSRFWEAFCQDGSHDDHVSLECTAQAGFSESGTMPRRVTCGTGNAPLQTASTSSGSAIVPTATASPQPTAAGGSPSSTTSGNVVTITNGLGYSNENPKANTTYQCAPGVVLDGQNRLEYAFHGDADNVTVRDCEIRDYDSPFQEAAIEVEGGSGWLITNNNIHDNANGGINIGGANHRAIDNYVHHNGQYGIAGGDFSNGSPGHNLLVEGNEIAWNNTAHNDAGFEAGGGKFTVVEGVTWRDNNIHHNSGPGIWCDAYCHDVLIEDNYIHENGSAGIFFEISYDAVIRNNTVTNNSTCQEGLRCETEDFWKKEIIIYNSGDLNIRSVIEGNNVSGPVGYLLFIHHEGRSVKLQNWLVRDIPEDEVHFFCEGSQSFCDGIRDSIVED